MDEYEAPLEPMEPAKKPRGCWFYGCLTAGILGVAFLVIIGLAGLNVYRSYTKMVNEYTSTAPMELPKVELPKEDAEALDARVEAFKKSLDTGKDAEPLVLTADEINALIAKNPEFQNRVHVEIPGDKIEGQISLPLTQLGLPGLNGRYLNGKARFNVMLSNRALFVTLDALEVNGKPVPDQALASFRAQNLAAGYADDPDNAKTVEKLESIEVKDGKLIVKPRARAEREKDKDEDKDKDEEREKASKPDASKNGSAPKDEVKAEPKGEKTEPDTEKKSEATPKAPE